MNPFYLMCIASMHGWAEVLLTTNSRETATRKVQFLGSDNTTQYYSFIALRYLSTIDLSFSI
jgi:hypothetical protein